MTQSAIFGLLVLFPTCCMLSMLSLSYKLSVSGYLPFFADTQQELFEKIMSGVFQFSQPVWKDISDEGMHTFWFTILIFVAKDFITRLLTLAPASRPSAAECLKHPWLSVFFCLLLVLTCIKGAAKNKALPTTASMSDVRSGFNPKTRGKQ